jgi:hypothetical protein
VKSTSLSVAVCEEFTNTLLVDSKRGSILFNIDKAWFDILDIRLKQLGYTLVHKSKIGEGYTCTYLFRVS